MLDKYYNRWPVAGGLALLLIAIDYDTTDKAIVRWNDETREKRYKIYYTKKGRAYIRKAGRRWYFDECMTM